MKWIIDDKEFEEAREAADYIMENCDEDYYDNMLDEIYEEVMICGYAYAPSHALREVDPIAYRCGRADWEDAEASDIAYELERMDDGETYRFFGFKVECIEEIIDTELSYYEEEI